MKRKIFVAFSIRRIRNFYHVCFTVRANPIARCRHHRDRHTFSSDYLRANALRGPLNARTFSAKRAISSIAVLVAPRKAGTARRVICRMQFAVLMNEC